MIRDKTLIKTVLERDIGLCQCCGFKADSVHHIVPLVYGGTDELTNMVSLCDFCHGQAPDTIEEFNEYKRIGGAKLPYLIGISMLKSDGNQYHIIKELIKQIRQCDITQAIEIYGVK